MTDRCPDGEPQSIDADSTYRLVDWASNRVRWDRWLKDALNAGAPQISAHLDSFATYGANVTLHIVEDCAGRILSGVGLAAWSVPGIAAQFGVGIGAPVGDAKWWPPLLRGVAEWCRRRKWLCVEFGPHVPSTDEKASLALADAGFAPAPLFAPVECIGADLRIALQAGSEEDLLRSFRRQTRQHVLRSLEAGNDLLLPEAEGDILAAVEFLHATAAENHVSIGALNRLSATVLDLVKSQTGYIALVCREGQPLAGGVFVRVGLAHRCYRLATKRGFSDARAAYYLHWRAMLRARDEQASWYYMTGRSAPSVYQFKRGFRPDEFQLIGPHRLVFRPALMRAIEKFRPLGVRLARRCIGVVDRIRNR